MNHYCNANLSRNKWQKQPPHILPCFESKGRGAEVKRRWNSKPITLVAFEEHLESGRFSHDAFDLYTLQCEWLDASISMGSNFHMVDKNGETLKFQTPTTLGADFPLIPRLDREGFLFSSLQLLLQNKILSSRRRLVTNSATLAADEWLDGLRSFASDCVALVDITLHQLYFKAQYAPRPGWKFDPLKLGQRHGQKLSEKLRWVYQITGNFLNIRDEEVGFNRLRSLRNHLQHFDFTARQI